MEHSDWIGISILVSSATSSIIAIMAAFQSLKNKQAIKQVEQQANGLTDRLIASAHKAGRQEVVMEALESTVIPILKK